MTDKERLIELLHKAEDICDSTLDCDTCKYVLSGSCKTVLIADYLLANGVILPPCKVGDIVYTIFEGDIEALKVAYTKTEESVEFVYRYYDAKNKFLYMPFSDRSIGKTAFLTKEEAEEKLKEFGK